MDPNRRRSRHSAKVTVDLISSPSIIYYGGEELGEELVCSVCKGPIDLDMICFPNGMIVCGKCRQNPPPK